MKKNIFFIIFSLFFCISTSIAQNPFTKVNDKAANYNGSEFSGNNSQGTGFESNSNWTVQTTGFGSASISSNELYSKSFFVTAGFTTGSHTATISREFDDPMTANDVFSIKFACQDFIDSNANFSIELHDSSDQKLLSLSFSYGDTNYTIFEEAVQILDKASVLTHLRLKSNI